MCVKANVKCTCSSCVCVESGFAPGWVSGYNVQVVCILVQ